MAQVRKKVKQTISAAQTRIEKEIHALIDAGLMSKADAKKLLKDFVEEVRAEQKRFVKFAKREFKQGVKKAKKKTTPFVKKAIQRVKLARKKRLGKKAKRKPARKRRKR